MHIAVVSTLPPSKGSLCEYGEHFVRALLDHPEVSKITVIADVTSAKETLAHPKLEVKRVWSFNDPRSGFKILSALNQSRASGAIFNLQFATFGSHRVPAALGLLTPMLTRLLGTPSIALLHNLMDTVDLERAGFHGNPIVNTLTRFAGTIMTRAILASSSVATTMPRYVEILTKKYNGKNVFHSPHGAFSRRDIAPLPTKRTVMTFGKFGTYKTVEALIEAHRLLLEKDPEMQLVIAGSDSPNAQGYLQGVKERYTDVANIQFTGYVPEEKIASVFQNCSVVAFPYNSTTGSSGVLHQAGEFGRAAVMPNIGDLADLVKDEGYIAEFFEPENPEDIADAIWNTVELQSRAEFLGKVNHQAASGVLISDVVHLHVQRLQVLLKKQTNTTVQQAHP